MARKTLGSITKEQWEQLQREEDERIARGSGRRAVPHGGAASGRAGDPNFTDRLNVKQRVHFGYALSEAA